MNKRNGITSTTYERMMVGPGAVYKGFVSPGTPGTLLGATIGGNNIEIARTWHTPELDGALGPIMGTRTIIQEIPTLTTRLVEVTKENLMLALAGAVVSSFGSPATHDVISSNAEVSVGNYLDIAIVGEIIGKQQPICFVIKNALSTEPLAIATGSGKEDVAMNVTFTGHYDPASPNVPPYKIYSPV